MAKPWWRGFTRVAERDPRSRPGARADLVHETFAVKGDRSRIQATPSTNVRALRYAPPRPRVIRSRLPNGGRMGRVGRERENAESPMDDRLVARVDRVESAKTRSKTVLIRKASRRFPSFSSDLDVYPIALVLAGGRVTLEMLPQTSAPFPPVRDGL